MTAPVPARAAASGPRVTLLVGPALGHVIRIQAVARALRDRHGCRIRILSPGTKDHAARILGGEFDTVILPIPPQAENLPMAPFAEGAEADFARHPPDLLVQDLTPTHWLSLLRPPDCPRVMITNIFLTRALAGDTLQARWFARLGPRLAGWRAARGLPPLAAAQDLYEADAVLLADPPALWPEGQGALPGHYHFCGPVFADTETGAALPPELQTELQTPLQTAPAAGAADLLLLSMGSTGRALPDPGLVARLRARAGARAAVYAGPDPAAARAAGLAEHCHDWLPLAPLLARTRLALTQGGTGSSYMALARGVPVVVMPSHRNHALLGQLLERAGLGLCLQEDPESGDDPATVTARAAARIEAADFDALRARARAAARPAPHPAGPHPAGPAARGAVDIAARIMEVWARPRPHPRPKDQSRDMPSPKTSPETAPETTSATTPEPHPVTTAENAPDPTLVIVIGCQRSGTTLTGQILGAHPRAVLLDEQDGMYEWFDALDPDRPYAGPEFETMLARAAGKYARPETRFRRDGQGRIGLHPKITHLVLKAPNLTYRRARIRQLRADLRVVALIRDPRDVVASMQRLARVPMVANQTRHLDAMADRPAWAEADLALLRDPALDETAKRAVVWRMKTRLARGFAVLKNRYMPLIYEELVARPDEMLPLLARHAGFSPKTGLGDHAGEYVGKGPGGTDRTRSIDTGSLGRARATLSPAEQARVLDLAGPQAIRYARPRRFAAPPPRDPLVLVGRGGSGTRLLSEIMLDAGMFLGNALNLSYDTVEATPTIYALLRDKLQRSPDPDVLAVPDGALALQEMAARMLERSAIADPAQRVWGWKLPETMFLIPEVLHAFSGARIVHILRHPVTSSLRRTHKTSREEDEIGRFAMPAARARVPVPDRHGLDPDSLANAISWHLQVASVTRFCRAQLPPERYLELRYEDLFEDWPGARARLAAFSGLPEARFTLPPLDPARARAFDLPDPRIGDVWTITGEIAALHGYGLGPDGAPIVRDRRAVCC